MDKKRVIKKEEDQLGRKRKYQHDVNVDEDDLCRLSLYLPYDRPITRPEQISQPSTQQQQQQQPASCPPSPPLDELPSHDDAMLAGQILFPLQWLGPSLTFETSGVDGYTNNETEDDLYWLALSLSIHGPNTMSPRLSPRIQQQQQQQHLPFLPSPPLRVSPSHTTTLSQLLLFQPPDLLQTSRVHGYSNNEQLKAPSARRVRRNPKKLESETIPPPYPWAKDQRATIHTLHHLESQNITTVSGEVQCKRCEKTFQLQFNLREKFTEIANFIVTNRGDMRDRAPVAWMNPRLPTCKFCNTENSAKPVLGDDIKTLNWLFLLLGGMLGCCTLEQLKYFCKYTRNHRTGAKDRVLYLTYLHLCKQLDPNGPFDHDH